MLAPIYLLFFSFSEARYPVLFVTVTLTNIRNVYSTTYPTFQYNGYLVWALKTILPLLTSSTGHSLPYTRLVAVL